eukprot:15408015-Alexandrium_andersonii.AAC.1
MRNRKKASKASAPAPPPASASPGPSSSQPLLTIPEVQRAVAPKPSSATPGAVPKATAGAQVQGALQGVADRRLQK